MVKRTFYLVSFILLFSLLLAACGPSALANADYSGQDLSGKNFSGKDIGGANFSGANLSGANLSGASLGQSYTVQPAEEYRGLPCIPAEGEAQVTAIYNASEVKAWDAAAGDFSKNFKLTGERPQDLDMSPDCRLLAYMVDAGTGAREIKLLDTSSGAESVLAEGNIWDLQWAPLGTNLLTLGFGSAVLWELDGMQPTKRVDFDTDMRSATFSLDGRYLVYSVMGKGLRFYSIQNETLTQIEENWGGWFMDWAPDGTLILDAGNTGVVGVFDPDSQTLLRTYEERFGDLCPESNDHTVCQYAKGVFSPDGEVLATGMSDGTVILWDHAAGAALAAFDAGNSDITYLRWMPDGSALVTGTETYSGGLWQLADIFSAANLSGANLSGADLSGANLAGVDLTGAVLTDANLSGADLRGANLSGLDLRSVILTDADLTHADLSDADLTGVDISGADFLSADLGNTLIDPVALVSARGSVANFMQPACMGEAVELAPAYQGGSASLIVLKQAGGTHRWEDSLPVRFQPAEGELPQLALCVEVNEKRVDSCAYVGLGSLPVVRQEASLTLYAAQTGEVLGQTTLLGGDPECPHAVMQGTRQISGGSPSWDAVESWMGEVLGP
jgi:uncharacterized protein YjbI with pentapeptide repeats